MTTLNTDSDLSFAQKLEDILTLFELKLTETQQAVASHQSANSEARVLAAIDSLTRLECLNWVLEMLPALKNVHQENLGRKALQEIVLVVHQEQMEKMVLMEWTVSMVLMDKTRLKAYVVLTEQMAKMEQMESVLKKVLQD